MFETWMLRYSMLETLSCDSESMNSVLDSLGDVTSCARVGLDSCTILAVEHLAVLEQDIGDIVVALAANTSNRETVAAIAVHV